jgi:hypothetical protein
MTETRGSVLRFCIAFALSGVKLHVGKRFLKPDLTEEQRYAAADRVIAALRKRHGYGPWLDQPQEAKSNGPHWEYKKRMEEGG